MMPLEERGQVRHATAYDTEGHFKYAVIVSYAMGVSKVLMADLHKTSHLDLSPCEVTFVSEENPIV